jgi:hypothetical protein
MKDQSIFHYTQLNRIPLIYKEFLNCKEKTVIDFLLFSLTVVQYAFLGVLLPFLGYLFNKENNIFQKLNAVVIRYATDKEDEVDFFLYEHKIFFDEKQEIVTDTFWLPKSPNPLLANDEYTYTIVKFSSSDFLYKSIIDFHHYNPCDFISIVFLGEHKTVDPTVEIQAITDTLSAVFDPKLLTEYNLSLFSQKNHEVATENTPRMAQHNIMIK